MATTATTRPPTPAETWIADGVLVADATPSFTLYRMRFTDDAGRDRDIVGVLGGLEVVDVGAGGVLPHERTTPKAITDRLDLTRATHANLSPVWGLSLATGLTALLVEPGEPVGIGDRRRRRAHGRAGDRSGASVGDHATIVGRTTC